MSFACAVVRPRAVCQRSGSSHGHFLSKDSPGGTSLEIGADCVLVKALLSLRYTGSGPLVQTR